MPGEPPPVVVRTADLADAPRIAEVVTEALGDKYRPALGRDARRAVEGLVARDIRAGGASRYWAAEIDGRVVGAARLALGGGGSEGLLRALISEAGLLQGLRAAAVLSLLGEGGHAPDEAYIDELGVDAAARRRGVARALLDACEREARRAGKRRLTLWVTVNNRAARPLYESAGFRVTRRRRWLVGRLLFRAPGALLMEKALAPR